MTWVDHFSARRGHLAAVVLIATALTACATGTELAGRDAGAESVVGLLGRDPVAADAVDVEAVPAPKTPLTQVPRACSSRVRTTYWVATDEAGAICLIAGQDTGSSEWAAALTCAPPSVVEGRGLSLRLEVSGHGSDTTLVADGTITPEVRRLVEESGGSVPVGNLVVFPWGNGRRNSSW